MDQRKLFWLLVAAMSLISGFFLPLLWGVVATFPILVLAWWIVYRSDWF